MKRFIVDILLFISALFLPTWATLAFGFVLFFLFEPFYEVLLAALFLDALYGAPTSRFGGFPFVLSAVTFVLYLILFFLKQRMRLPGMFFFERGR